jgi:membrane associated rhomboid family serine protease
VLYLVAILGGSVLVLWMNSPFSWTVGASGGIFGLMGAYFVLMRAIGGNASQVMGLIAINLVFSFLPGVSWQGHIGGLIAGGAVALVMSKTRTRRSQPAQVVGVAIVIGLILFAAYLRLEQLLIIPLGIPSLPNVVE